MKKGFTLIEILIVIAIIALLIVFVIMNMQGQNARATDLRRKIDLYNLHNALEEYKNDKGAFPPTSTVQSCGSAGLVPYMRTIPCDPQTGVQYGYFLSATGGYRLCTKLADTTDVAIISAGCAGALGCGLGNGYNYCVSSGTTPSAAGTVDQIITTPTPTPTPTPTTMPSSPTPTPMVHFACAPADLNGTSYCNYYSDPVGSGCPRTFADGSCNSACGVVANRCQQ